MTQQQLNNLWYEGENISSSVKYHIKDKELSDKVIVMQFMGCLPQSPCDSTVGLSLYVRVKNGDTIDDIWFTAKADEDGLFPEDITKSLLIKCDKWLSNFNSGSKTTDDICIVSASYVCKKVLDITFSNGVKKMVNFSPFFADNKIEYLEKYKSVSSFKKFKIQDGNIVWGKDWDLIFPIEQIYLGEIKQ